MIFKILRKDEDSKSMTYVPNMAYVLKFAKSKKGQISTAYYKSKSNAEKALASLKKDGINGIITKQQNVGFDIPLFSSYLTLTCLFISYRLYKNRKI